MYIFIIEIISYFVQKWKVRYTNVEHFSRFNVYQDTPGNTGSWGCQVNEVWDVNVCGILANGLFANIDYI
jgi:hypothetical protein